MPLTLEQKKKVRNEADSLREKLGVQAESFPINLDQLASILGYTVSTFIPDTVQHQEISGAIDHEQKQILINGSEVIQRQFFTLAHELGHAVLHQDEDMVDYRNADKSAAKEQEADLFAAELIMPESKFYEKWYQTNQDRKAIAAFFGVSIPAVNTRASWLGLR